MFVVRPKAICSGLVCVDDVNWIRSKEQYIR